MPPCLILRGVALDLRVGGRQALKVAALEAPTPTQNEPRFLFTRLLIRLPGVGPTIQTVNRLHLEPFDQNISCVSTCSLQQSKITT
jgi:hypothetical protein